CIDGGTALQKVCIFRAVVIEHLRSVEIFDRRCRRTGSFCSYSRDRRSQCSLFGVLDRALMRVDLIVLQRQDLAVGVVDDKRMNIQSLKMCRLSCAAVSWTDGRIEAQIKRGQKPEKSESIAFCAEYREICSDSHL